MHLQIPVSFITFISNISLNIILIPIYGIWGLIASLIFSSLSANTYMFFKLKDFFNNRKMNRKFFLQITMYVLIILIVYYIIFLDIDIVTKIILKTLLLLGYFFMIIMTGIINFKRVSQLVNQSIQILFRK